ncbi:MAG: DUF1501 domain-containing protein, partial [Planctomycetaceae bacterium]|nr:DUF1501 domain-containing protein [Planctomycetaceae bacterium]
MISVLGSANPFARGMHRREVMRIGGLGALSLSLPQLLQLESRAAANGTFDSTFGRAKRIMLLYLQGAASQFETWDPKPLAPEEIRGQFGAISTLVPGTQVCEKLPKLSQQAHRLALVRSMTHDNNNHSNLYTLSGFPALDFTSETNPFDSRHHPFFGSVIDYLADQQNPHESPELPRNIGLPFRFTTYGQLFRRAGPYGAFLGSGYDPVWTEFDGKATRSVPRVSFFDRLKDVHVEDPYLGITPESRMRISKDARLRDEMQLDRLDSRRTLAQQLEDQVRTFDACSAAKSIDRFRDMAYTLMTSEKLRRALDVGEEPMELREQYGMTLFGQATLTG